MRIGELTPPEQRVLGCLLEKRWTTPEQYPLSLNALRLACNQSTNRDPVTEYDETTVREAAQRLCRYGLARLASGHSSRATKYRHLAEETLGLGREELAVLTVLLLRGPQTPGEIKSRSERIAHAGTLLEVEQRLDALCERGYVRCLPRRPGQKEDRFEHLLGAGEPQGRPAESAAPALASTAAPNTAGPPIATTRPPDSGATAHRSASAPTNGGVTTPTAADLGAQDRKLAERVDVLEREVRTLRDRLAAIEAELGYTSS